MPDNKKQEELFEEFLAFQKEKQKRLQLYLTDQDLQELFRCSRMTLFRARRDGRIPYENDHGGRIIYPYDSVMLAIKTNRLSFRGLSKINAIERLETYKKLLEL